jgi:inner membrane protein
LLALVMLPLSRDVGHRRAWLFFFLAGCSHILLDSITTRGGTVAVFAPFHNERYRLPWELIEISPMSIRRFFSARGLRILASEFLWVWIPAFCFAAVAMLGRRARPRVSS